MQGSTSERLEALGLGLGEGAARFIWSKTKAKPQVQRLSKKKHEATIASCLP